MAGGRRRYRWVSPAQRAVVARRVGDGVRVAVVAAEFGVSPRTVQRIANEAALARRGRQRSPRCLSVDERERIFVGVCRGESDSEIARVLGRDRSTIGREIKRCGGRRRYRPMRAERRAQQAARRPKPTKLAACPRLLEAVEVRLGWRWSPQQISARLKLDYPDDGRMRISHETIYRSLYVQSRGELRRQLAANLRTGRSTRRARGRVEMRGRIVDMVAIAKRPPEADDRRVPGHWEGDLLIGAAGKSAIATLVERQTRYVLLARLGDDRTTATVTAALKQRIQDLPGHLIKSLTWDQGRELAAHKAFTIDTGVAVYFCDPHSPWQRGSNENTNGLLRQYLPRKVDLAQLGQIDLDEIAAELNGRPRKTLDWQTPAERMTLLLR
jgi:transposase, IS30 family